MTMEEPDAVTFGEFGSVAQLRRRLAEARRKHVFLRAINAIAREKSTGAEEKVRRMREVLDMNREIALRLGGPADQPRHAAGAVRLHETSLWIVERVLKALRPGAAVARFPEGAVVDDERSRRVQIYFYATPSEFQTEALKANGFVWSGAMASWHQVRNARAVAAALRLTGASFEKPPAPAPSAPRTRISP